MSTKKGGLRKAAIAALLASSLGLLLLDRAPQVEPSFPVTSPSTRGFGIPCQTSDFTTARFFTLGLHPWNEGALLPLEAAVRTVERLGIWEPHTFSGSYVCRLVRGSTTTYSHHAWAVAVDFDAAQNCLGCSVSSSEIGKHPEFVRSFTRYGFFWGGNFSSRPDAMHFEYDGPWLPARSDRIPNGPDAGDELCRALRAVGLPGDCTDGLYAGKEITAVVAFQKTNHLLKIDLHAIVGPPTWTLLLLGAR